MTRTIRTMCLLLATAAGQAMAQRAAAQPTTAPAREWFGADKPAAGFFPDLNVDPAIADALPRTIWNALAAPGMPPVRMPRLIVPSDLFTQASQKAYEATNPRDASVLVPDERRARLVAINAQQQGAAICLDVEVYSMSLGATASDAEIDLGTRQMAKMIGWMRDQAPTIRIFSYGIAPESDFYGPSEAYVVATTRPTGEKYGWWKAHQPDVEARLDSWMATNARMRRAPGRSVAFADLFDGLCPSLYLGRTDKPMSTIGIQGLVRGHVAESRKYGKSIYPFVWPCWYETKEPVDLGNWVTELREITRFADGAVLWSDGNAWDFPITFRVRIATELAKRHGRMTNRELHDVLAPDFKNYRELDQLLTLTNEADEQQLP